MCPGIPAAGVQPCNVGNVSSMPGAARGRANTRRRPGSQAGQGERSKRGTPMSEQASGTHGPVRDDAIKRQDEAEAAGYAAEWPAPDEEPDDETEREAIWAPAARLAPEDWEAVELRSDLARHLDRTAWPLTRGRLLEILTERHAGDRLVELAASLPEGQRYQSLRELARALDLEPEERGG